jgi:hypothetical protein
LLMPRDPIGIKGSIGLVVSAVDHLAGARNPALVPVELHEFEHPA